MDVHGPTLTFQVGISRRDVGDHGEVTGVALAHPGDFVDSLTNQEPPNDQDGDHQHEGTQRPGTYRVINSHQYKYSSQEDEDELVTHR